MANNVKDPLNLAQYAPTTVESVTKAANLLNYAHRAYNRQGLPPTAAGDYVAGICTKSSLTATDRVVGLATSGYSIGRVAANTAITVDMPLAANTAGELIPATGTMYVLGRAMDSCSATAGVSYYVGVELA